MRNLQQQKTEVDGKYNLLKLYAYFQGWQSESAIWNPESTGFLINNQESEPAISVDSYKESKIQNSQFLLLFLNLIYLIVSNI